MKTRKLIWICSLFMSILFIMISCKKEKTDEESDTTTFEYPTATITHNAFDFF